MWHSDDARFRFRAFGYCLTCWRDVLRRDAELGLSCMINHAAEFEVVDGPGCALEIARLDL